jgi:hypothetical protein
MMLHGDGCVKGLRLVTRWGFVGAGSYVIHIVHKPFLGAQFGTEGSNLNTPFVGGGRVVPEFYVQSPAPSASPLTDSTLGAHGN